MAFPAVLVKACLNGGRRRAEHPTVPETPAELAAEAAAAVLGGAGALHFHPRAADGAETLAGPDVDAAVRAVRAACPATALGISTGLWITGGDPEARLRAVAGWRELPDFASVNVSEPGWDELARVLLERGVGVEAGLFTAAGAEALAASPFATRVLRALVEPQEADAGAAIATAAAVEDALDAGGVAAPRLHHGAGPATWAVIRAALARGRDVRAGLEDTDVLPDGRRAAGNAELVAAAVALARAAG